MTDRSSKASAVALIVSLVLCGALLGVAIDRVYLSCSASEKTEDANKARRRRRRGRKHKLKRLMRLFKKRLKLTADQERVVREALGASWEEMKPIRRRIEPELKVLRERARLKIRNALTPEQLKTYEKMVARYEARRAKRFQ